MSHPDEEPARQRDMRHYGKIKPHLWHRGGVWACSLRWGRIWFNYTAASAYDAWHRNEKVKKP